MAVVDIKRIIIGFLESEREAVVSALKRLGTVHIDDMFPILEEETEAKDDGEIGREEVQGVVLDENFKKLPASPALPPVVVPRVP